MPKDRVRWMSSAGVRTSNTGVVQGPYAHVRNPMVVAGLGQGIAVSIAMQSIAVTAYVHLGGLIWNFLVRPAEEVDLSAHFGSACADDRRRRNRRIDISSSQLPRTPG